MSEILEPYLTVFIIVGCLIVMLFFSICACGAFLFVYGLSLGKWLKDKNNLDDPKYKRKQILHRICLVIGGLISTVGFYIIARLILVDIFVK